MITTISCDGRSSSAERSVSFILQTKQCCSSLPCLRCCIFRGGGARYESFLRCCCIGDHSVLAGDMNWTAQRNGHGPLHGIDARQGPSSSCRYAVRCSSVLHVHRRDTQYGTILDTALSRTLPRPFCLQSRGSSSSNGNTDTKQRLWVSASSTFGAAAEGIRSDFETVSGQRDL